MLFNQNQVKKVVFCDFDGTITAVETFVGMLKEFTPELADQIMPQLYARKLTLREGVRKMLESIPSAKYNDIITYGEDKPIRPGLKELLDFLDSYQVPFVVVSGGIKGMIVNVLSRQGLLERVETIEAVEANNNEEYLQVHSPFEDGTELVAKVKVMANYPNVEHIAIGDSVTDLNMALKADLVFARDRLIEYMKAENKPYIPWENFFDIRDFLAKQWNNN